MELKYVILGTAVHIESEFRSEVGTMFDPTTPTFKIHEPDAVETAYVYGVDIGVIRDGQGLYSMWFMPTKVGDHIARTTTASGARAVAKEEMFVVVPSGFVAP